MNLKKEYKGLTWQETCITFMQRAQLSERTKGSAGAAYRELAGLVRRELKSLDAEYFERLATAMEKWVMWWERSQLHAIPFVASRASSAPTSKGSTCAAFTITRNEPKNLPKWLEYYGKHVAADDLWVLDYSSTDGSTAELYNPSGGGRKARIKRLVPDHFLNRAVEKHQRLLLRSGYTCVVFTEIDEFLVPDPQRYPGGLREYLARFAQGPDSVIRADGRQLVESTNDPRPFDWSRPFLDQCSQWRVSDAFSKPYITKVPLKYHAGFQTASFFDQVPVTKEVDSEIKLVHTEAADKELCIEREALKHKASSDMRKNEKAHLGLHFGPQFQSHVDRADLCTGLPAEGAPEVIPSHFRAAII